MVSIQSAEKSNSQIKIKLNPIEVEFLILTKLDHFFMVNSFVMELNLGSNTWVRNELGGVKGQP